MAKQCLYTGKLKGRSESGECFDVVDDVAVLAISDEAAIEKIIEMAWDCRLVTSGCSPFVDDLECDMDGDYVKIAEHIILLDEMLTEDIVTSEYIEEVRAKLKDGLESGFVLINGDSYYWEKAN